MDEANINDAIWLIENNFENVPEYLRASLLVVIEAAWRYSELGN